LLAPFAVFGGAGKGPVRFVIQDWLVRFDERVVQASFKGTFRGGFEFGVSCSSFGGVHAMSVAEEN
jgi:hypothetical protein